MYLIKAVGITLLVISTVLCTITTAYAQSQKFVEQNSAELNRQLMSFSAIEGNLIEMAKAAEANESNNLTQVFYFTSNLRANGRQLLTVAVIYQRLRDQRDAADVLKVLEVQCKLLKDFSKLTVEQLNQRLVAVKTAAILAEMGKARDTALALGNPSVCKLRSRPE